MNEIIRYCVAILFGITGVTGCTIMLLKDRIKQPTYCFLIIVCIFIAIWVGYSDRVKEFSIGVGKMTMVLNEMKDTQSDIQDREKKIEKLAVLMGDLVTYIQATSLTMNTTADQDKWLKFHLDRLSSLSNKKIDNPFSRFTQRLSNRRPDDEKELIQIWEDYEKDLETEIKKLESH